MQILNEDNTIEYVSHRDGNNLKLSEKQIFQNILFKRLTNSTMCSEIKVTKRKTTIFFLSNGNFAEILIQEG